jgi:amino acid transporter
MADPRGPLNPLVPPEPLSTWIQTTANLSTLITPPVFVLALASLVIRFRRSRDVERQQIKWFLFVAAVATMLFVVSMLSTGAFSDVVWALGLLTMAFLPLAIGLAILRYRLYDIDRVVSRAVGYTLVTATLAAAFAVAVIVAQTILTPVTQSSTLAVAASTLVVAALFQPVRRAIQGRVDRRFDRSRVNAERLVTTFGDTLRDVTDLPTIHDTLVATVGTTWAPADVGIWVRPAR